MQSVACFLCKLHGIVKLNKTKKYVLVLGNMTCDLDSLASAVGYSFIKDYEKGDSDVCYLPVCNIHSEDMPLRTEAVFWLKHCSIDPRTLFYTNTLGRVLDRPRQDFISSILVDHFEMTSNSMFKKFKVGDIIDHHPLPPNFSNPNTCSYFRVEMVGSCSSLVAEELVKRVPKTHIPLELCKLLYGAILTDTVGLSDEGKKLGRSTDQDFAAAKMLEDITDGLVLNEGETREYLFQQLSNAKFYVKGLSVVDLLRRDMKLVAANVAATPEIACSTISGMDFFDMTSREEFIPVAENFCSNHSVKVLVCITIGPTDSEPRGPLDETLSTGSKVVELLAMRRGVIVFSVAGQKKFGEKLVNFLTTNGTLMQLGELYQVTSNESKNFVWTATLNNNKITRKAVIPIISRYLQTIRGIPPE